MPDATTDAEATSQPGPDITTAPYRQNGRNVYADGALIGCYWPGEKPQPWADTSHDDANCEPGIHAETPFHARPLFGLGPATHHTTPEEAIGELLRAREKPNREQVEIYDSLSAPEPGVREAVRHARHLLAKKGII